MHIIMELYNNDNNNNIVFYNIVVLTCLLAILFALTVVSFLHMYSV